MRRREGVVVEGGEWAAHTSVELWVDGLACVPGLGTSFALDAYAHALDALARGVPATLACEAAGLTSAEVHHARQRYPQVDQLFVRARAMAAGPLVEKVMRSDDWRAAAWMLERNVGREEFRQEKVQQDKLVIEINVSRDQQIARDNGVVDVTPEPVNAKVVAELPAKR